MSMPFISRTKKGQSLDIFRGVSTYVELDKVVNMAPTNVRMTIDRSRMFDGVCGISLNE